MAYVRHDESQPIPVQIVVENIGRGLALDVTFQSLKACSMKLEATMRFRIALFSRSRIIRPNSISA